MIPFEKLLQRFKRKIDKSKILEEARANMYYTKPSEEKRKKKILIEKRKDKD